MTTGKTPADKGRARRRPARVAEGVAAQECYVESSALAEADRAVIRARTAGRLTAEDEGAAIRRLHKHEIIAFA